MRRRSASIAVVLFLGVLATACAPLPKSPPPPPPAPPPPAPTTTTTTTTTTVPPAPAPLSFGWAVPGVTGPVAADTTETPNLVWATGGGVLHGLNATTGATVASHPLALSGDQHFPTPTVIPNWVLVESTNHIAAFNTPAAATASWLSPALDGTVQSRPVVVGNTVVVATENDSLYGLNLADGTIAWGPGTAPATHFGTAEPLSEDRQVGSVPGCGNIDPLGVTSNLVYDPNTGLVYAVGERELAGSAPHTPEFVLVGVNPSNGIISATWPKTISGPLGGDAARQLQRAGLAAANGNIYVGFGGLAGDCGTYHGYVIAASDTDGHVVNSFQVAPAPSNAGAVWGTSGIVPDSAGNVYATTGNSFNWPSTGTDYSDGLLKLSATAGLQDYFQPPAWKNDNAADADLGSTGPVLLESRGQVFVVGKQHDAFLLNISSLGGPNHETPAASLANACSGEVFGQNAAIGSSVYIACSNGIRQIVIN